MIRKIQINQVASYRQEATLETDKPINLIYGLNGSGKTTISKYLQNPTSNEGFTHCHLGQDNPDGSIIRVYNQSFVEDVFHNQDKQNGIFTLSKENKDIENQIKQAIAGRQLIAEEGLKTKALIGDKEKEIQALTSKTQDTCFKIKTDFTGAEQILDEAGFLYGFKHKKARLLEHLLSLQKSPTVKTVENIKKEVELLNNSDDSPTPPLPPIKVSDSLQTIESNELLSEAIIGNENSTLSKLIKHLGNSDWFSQGIDFLNRSEDKCPFCQQEVDTELQRKMKDFIDLSYKKNVRILDSMLSSYRNLASSIPSLDEYTNSSFIENKSELESSHKLVTTILGANIKELEKKVKSPSIVTQLQPSNQSIEQLNSLIETANKKISTHNKKIKNKRTALESLKSEFWQIQRNEYDHVLASHTSSLAELKKELNTHEEERKKKAESYTKATNTIKELQSKTINIDETIDNINTHLTDCGLEDFKIVKEGDRFYRIAREGDDGSDKVFATLSEGEKTMISFFYFLELCKGKSDPSETQQKIIVIDDPISSLSHMYVFNIAQLIKREFFDDYKLKKDPNGKPEMWTYKNNAQYTQCFILTHNLYFFYELSDSKNHSERKFFQNLYRVTKNNSGSQIKPLAYSEIQNEYQGYWSVIRDKDSPPALLALCMRNIIEYFFGFIEKKELSNVFHQNTDQKFQTFYRYINRESHSIAQNINDTKEFDYDQFLEVFKYVFDQTGYLPHYEKMMKF